MVLLNACYLASAETAGAHDLDAFCAHAHCTAHCVLHCAAVRNTLLDLLCDVLRYELSIGIGGADLNDGDRYGLAYHLLDGQADALDLCAALADNDAGSGAVDIDAYLIGIALDLDGRNTGGIEGLLQVVADIVVFNDKIADLVCTGVPTGIPVLDNADAHAVRINFLSHLFCLLP